MKNTTNDTSRPAPRLAPESADPSALYGKHFPRACRELILGKARELGAQARSEELVGSEYRVLCTLERIGEKMIITAEALIDFGMSHDTAYAPWWGFKDAVRLILQTAPSKQRRPDRDGKPVQSGSPAPAPRPESTTAIGDTLSPKKLAALADAVVPPRPTDEQADAAATTPAAPRGKGKRVQPPAAPHATA